MNIHPFTRNKTPSRSRDGFTLIEVVISSALVALSLAGIWGIISWLSYSAYLTERRAEALSLAASKMEQIMLGSAVSGTDYRDQYRRQWTLADVDSTNRMITVNVLWVDPRNRTNQVTLRSGGVVSASGAGAGSFAGIFGGLP